MLSGFLKRYNKQLNMTSAVELIIVDGGSTDGTDELARHHADKYYQLELEGRGTNNIAIQRNFGASKATGEYQVHTDADVYLSDDLQIYRILTHLEKYRPNVCSLKILNQNGGPREFYRRHIHAVTSTFIIIKSSLLESVGGFKKRLWHDFWLDISCRIKGKSPYLMNEYVYHMREFNRIPFPINIMMRK